MSARLPDFIEAADVCTAVTDDETGGPETRVLGTLRLVDGEIKLNGFKPGVAAFLTGFISFGIPEEGAEPRRFTMTGDPEQWLRWLPYNLRGTLLWAQPARSQSST